MKDLKEKKVKNWESMVKEIKALFDHAKQLEQDNTVLKLELELQTNMVKKLLGRD